MAGTAGLDYSRHNLVKVAPVSNNNIHIRPVGNRCYLPSIGYNNIRRSY